jgi:hypothetical protein
MSHRLATIVVATLFVSGCAVYAPPKIDEKTGLYKQAAALDPGEIRKRDTNVDLKKFRFAYLISDSNVYPGRFEFFARSALARAGITRVLNTHEMTEWISSTSELSEIASLSDPISQRRLSERIGPVLLIQLSSMWDGDVTRDVDLVVTDLSTGKAMLEIHHHRFVWMEVDSEAHYPVFNELKKWAEECAPGKENT